jgi:putative membrane protein
MNVQEEHMYKMNFWLWSLVFLAIFIFSAINPIDRYTWLLEVLPAVVGALLLLYFRKSWPMTGLLYVLILIHCVILMIGGHYTYAEVPFFDDFLSFIWPDRNNYDKLGHFVQGFVPAMICREVIIRHDVIQSVGWRRFFIVCFCLALSAFYELLEWWVALLSDEAADSFLGAQGYVWDTQSDMFLALIGSILALVFLCGLHDKQLNNLEEEKS